MTHRERFVRLFNGESVDRAPFIDMMGTCNFPSCLPRWKTEGLAADADRAEVQRIIGFDYERGYYIYVNTFFSPEFEVELLRNEEGKSYRKNKWGALEVQKDGSELMPLTLEGPVKDRYSWDAVKERLRGMDGRLPANIAETCRDAAASGLPVWAGDLPAGFFGALREIMGFDNLMYTFYDDPGLLSEILDTLCELWIGLYTEIQRYVALDYVFIWEDMCNKSGPLISPALFREFLLPRYIRLTGAVRANGCPHFVVDSDGDERPLVPLWLEGGVDIAVPWETQFGLDILEVRKRFPTLGIIGGLDKRALEFDRARMDKELEKVPRMLEWGRYIPSCDHGVTADVSWDNYRYFYEKLREILDNP